MEEEEKIISMTPDELGYQDRGLMKWQGLILSAQREQIKEMMEEEYKQPPAAKKLMTEYEIAEIMHIAYAKKLPVNIQANILRNGHYYPDVNCVIRGYHDDKIYLKLKDGRQRSCTIDQIRNIEFANVHEWYEKEWNK